MQKRSFFKQIISNIITNIGNTENMENSYYIQHKSLVGNVNQGTIADWIGRTLRKNWQEAVFCLDDYIHCNM